MVYGIGCEGRNDVYLPGAWCMFLYACVNSPLGLVEGYRVARVERDRGEGLAPDLDYETFCAPSIGNYLEERGRLTAKNMTSAWCGSLSQESTFLLGRKKRRGVFLKHKTRHIKAAT